MKNIIMIGILLLFRYSSYAQNSPSVSLGYWADFGILPGVKVGVEYPILIGTVEKEKQRKRKKKEPKIRTIRNKHELLGGFSLGYTPLLNQHRLFFNLEVGYRITRKHGWFFDAWIGCAYENFVNTGKTFKVDDSGTVSKVPLASRGYVSPNLGIGFGYDFTQRLDFPMTVYTRILPAFRLGYNNVSAVTSVYLDAGVSYKF
ncbi:MAG: hypothetical protein GY810_21660 [Aureispira sp.]|nr:hypothetical protein [Aureispira sp.]